MAFVQQLVIIGGAEERSGDCQILREFVRRAGGRAAQIVVLTAATSEPEEAGKTYISVFKRLGAADVKIVDTRDRQDAEKLDGLLAIAQASGIFFTGGDQTRIVRAIKDTILDDAIRKRYQAGIVVGGTSAGAAMMPDKMIVDGNSVSSPHADLVKMAEGMGFLPNVVIDQHFSQRGRLGRLLSALLLEPSVLGFGIDENTAMVVDNDEFIVMGEGAVTVVDESATTHNNLEKKLLKDEPLAVLGVKLHILPQGYRFNLKTREATPPFV
ncbi:MAG: cyanophycinase [Timaviella obliquedivisa GSE-PSE-MK23-08B]|nr:cyanophycinase [Timaviella obliquedivisa GSE-PSE-MK23-08B]